MASSYDLVIVGGGLVGASLAAALANTSLRIAVIEPFAFTDSDQPSYDERTVALTYSARQIYSAMGLWQKIQHGGAERIHDIHISNAGHFGMTHLSCKDVGTDALGYVTPTRVIGTVLQQAIHAAENIDLFCPATATTTTIDETCRRIELETSDNGASKITSLDAALVVIADGGRSGLVDNKDQNQKPYPQQALLCFVHSTKPHNSRAYERFTSEGPLALLPHSENRYAVVWTCNENNFSLRQSLPDDEFIEQLQLAFGDRAGTFSNPSPRKGYPLGRSQLDQPVQPRMVMIGNAAHIVHPVAGQGFNLGLRDVASLAEYVYSAAKTSGDIGSADLLAQYATSRKRDTKMVGHFTHGLIELFSNEFALPALARNSALKMTEIAPPLKRFLLRKTMGLSGKQSALAMGIPLSSSIKPQIKS